MPTPQWNASGRLGGIVQQRTPGRKEVGMSSSAHGRPGAARSPGVGAAEAGHGLGGRITGYWWPCHGPLTDLPDRLHPDDRASSPPRVLLPKNTLANGLDLIVRRQGTLPIVAVNLWYHVGSKNEERRQRGFAHLLEHLMFEGSEHYPGDFFQPLQRLGRGRQRLDLHRPDELLRRHAGRAPGGSSWPWSPTAWASPAGPDRPEAAGPEGRRQERVPAELRQSALWPVPAILTEALYPPSHPYSWLTIGVMEDVERPAGMTSRPSSAATTPPATPAWPWWATLTRTRRWSWRSVTSARSPAASRPAAPDAAGRARRRRPLRSTTASSSTGPTTSGTRVRSSTPTTPP